jgi:hypothetical protein
VRWWVALKNAAVVVVMVGVAVKVPLPAHVVKLAIALSLLLGRFVIEVNGVGAS